MPDATARSWQGWRRAAVFGAIGTLLMIGSCTSFDVWADRRVEAEIARLEARYGSLDERTSEVPAVPAADNRAPMVRAAAALAIPRPGRFGHYIDLRATSPVPAELRAFAESNAAAIRLAGEIRTRRQSNWEFTYRSGTNWPPFETIRVLSDAIYVTALLNIEAGHPDEAIQMIVSGLGIAASLRQEPEVIAQMVRTGTVASRQVEAIRQLLTTSAPSKEGLSDLAWWLVENRMPDGMRPALLSEMREKNAMFARMENGDIAPGTASWIYPMTWPDWPSAFLGIAARIGRPFVRTARLRYLQYVEQLLEVESGPRPRIAVPEPPAPQRWALIDRLTDKFTAGSWRYSEVGDDFTSQLSAAELAVALRRFKLDHQAYPEDLSALAPAYLARVPIDPYTGQPPVYARQDAGFTLRPKASRPGMEKYQTLEWNVPK